MQIQNAIAEFKQKFAVSYIVSISGSADKKYEKLAEDEITCLVKGLKKSNSKFAVLSGGTKTGVPEIATQVARKNDIPTIGVFPPKARSSGDVLYDILDLPIETLAPSIGKPGFGTETPSFAQLPDYAVFIGGGLGTAMEACMMLKLNKSRIEKHEVPIFICPIGSDRATELIPLLASLEPILASCLAINLLSGSDAAEYIKGKELKKKVVAENEVK